jgi:hypothetical protein
MNLKKIEPDGVVCIRLAQNVVQWRAVVNIVIKGFKRDGEFVDRLNDC